MPIESAEYKKVFEIGDLPKVNNPLVLFTGSGIGDVLQNSKKHVVNTVHGKVVMLVGKIVGSNRDVVVIPRHADPNRTEVGHHRLPHQVNEPANAVAVAALNPRAVVTMHTIGVAATDKSFTPGALTIIGGLLRTRNSKTIYNDRVVSSLVNSGKDVPLIAHTPLPESKLKDLKLAKIVQQSAKESGLPMAKDVVCHTIPGPTYETDQEVRDLVARGVTGFAMTHEQDVVTLQEALQASSSQTPVVSVATISNFAQGIGDPPNHEEVARVVKSLEPKRNSFLKKLAEALGEI